MGADRDPKEMAMRNPVMNRWTAAWAAAVLAATLAPPAWAQAGAHGHDSHAGPAVHQLSLNQGRKWNTDEPLRAGMGRIRGFVEPGLGAAHAGKLGAAQYRELATKVEQEVGGIVANCKLEPQADAMLHLVIADIGAGADAMAGKSAELRPQQGLLRVAQAVNAYGSHFEHPGFRPLRGVH